jgi:uncharacterized protein YecE (DUF72 family)
VLLVGTSGWQYRDWRGTFYPDRLPQREWLRYFAGHFPTVEINNTFYNLPKESSFDRWRDDTPREFVITVKASRYITHIRRLRDAGDSVELLWSRASRLRGKLGPVLFQLPPRFRADVPLLRGFVEKLPQGMRPAFEFRDDSWRSDDVYEVLDGAGAAWVIPDRPRSREPNVVTGGWSYVRMHQGGHGPHRSEYTHEKLRRWADRVSDLPARDVFMYFNNDPGGAAVRDAVTMMDLLERRGQEVARPAQQSEPESARP